MFNSEKRRESRRIFFIITGPVLSALNMLELAKTDPGLNLGTVRRNCSWAWSTFSYLSDRMTEKHYDEVFNLIEVLQTKIQEYDWEPVRARDKEYDEWDRAMRYYNRIP